MQPSHLFDVLHVMFGGHKDDRLLLGLHHIPEQVQQHGRLVVQPQVEEGELGEDGENTISTAWTLTNQINLKYINIYGTHAKYEVQHCLWI